MTRRLIVRRTRLTDTAPATLWPDWRHHAFLTDLTGDAVEVDEFHRHHAVVELAIRDLKEGAGLEHVPSGNFHANSAWLQCAVLAHNLIRWTAIARQGPRRRPTDRRPHDAHPTRSPSPAGSSTAPGAPPCDCPTDWPWANTFTTALDTLRGLCNQRPADTPTRGQARRTTTTSADNRRRHGR